MSQITSGLASSYGAVNKTGTADDAYFGEKVKYHSGTVISLREVKAIEGAALTD